MAEEDKYPPSFPFWETGPTLELEVTSDHRKKMRPLVAPNLFKNIKVIIEDIIPVVESMGTPQSIDSGCC